MVKRIGLKTKRKLKRVKVLLLFLLFYPVGCGSRMPPPGKPDIDPPKLKILYPKDMDTVKGLIYVRYSYEDKSPLLWIQLYVDGRRTFLDSSLIDSIPFISDSLYDGIHKVWLQAIDKWDNLGKSKPVRIITLNGNKREDKDERVGPEHKGTKEKSR